MNKLQSDQSKFTYYERVTIWAVILSCLANITYLVSDYQLFHGFPWKTVLPRFFMVLILPIVLIIYQQINDYRIRCVISYLMCHGVMWCTIWAIYYLPDRLHANEGFIIMHLMFLAIGLSAPRIIGIIGHSLVLLNIIISYPINHYENFDLMLSLGIPCLIFIELLLVILDKTYHEHYELENKLEESLVKDNLTGAFNRNILNKITLNNHQHLIFENASLLMLDIDLFKRVNDTYGHAAGDVILKDLVSLLKSSVRESDYVIRFGGEEFLIILVGCSQEAAGNLAEFIRKSVSEYEHPICRFTISIGVTVYHGLDFQKDLNEADRTLYYAKEHGRNQVAFYENIKDTDHGI